MDDSEKEILENLKNFDTKKLIVKDTYVEIQTNEMTNFVYLLWLKVWADTCYTIRTLF